jgi:hypothetical protein
VTTILVGIKPDLKQYVRDDGTMLVELLKAVYGLKQGSAEFYNHLSSILEADGYKKSQADCALFVKTLPNGTQVYVLCYVDDFLIVGEPQAILQAQATLKDNFNEVTFSPAGATKLSYLGMLIKIKTKSIEISQPAYVEDIIASQPDYGTTPRTPYTAELHTVYPNSPALDDSDRELYRSLVMKLNFLALRSRPDIRLATWRHPATRRRTS